MKKISNKDKIRYNKLVRKRTNRKLKRKQKLSGK